MGTNAAKMNYFFYTCFPNCLCVIANKPSGSYHDVKVWVEIIEKRKHTINSVCTCKSSCQKIYIFDCTNGSLSTQCLNVFLLFGLTADNRYLMTLLHQLFC